ncbi:MAG: ROK family protein [Alicyclobacillus sp.]|nr:ROK family protein [Alicyclobacillus sp.]
MGVPKADRKWMREINSMQVLQQIRARGPVSRPELAEITGLGLSTISNITTELLNNNLVREVGEGDSSGGRRPSLLDLNELARYTFGVKIGPDKTWVSLFDLRARQISAAEIPVTRSERPQGLFVRIAEAVDELIRSGKIPRRAILGIGVSTSGLIDSETGTCVYSPILAWEHVPVRQHLTDLTKLEVVVENDVNAFAYGILHQDLDGAARNMICITTGPGVGAGIILDGKLYRGSRGGAGEFGHVSIDRHGPLCACGRRGCLEVLASDPFLVARAQELIDADVPTILRSVQDGQQPTPRSILLAAELGDEAMRGLYRELGENLGHGVANLINLFDPEKIVIGGEGAVAAKFFIDALREVAFRYAFPHLADHVEIVVDNGSEEAWLQGAALLVIDKFFEIPLPG